MDLSGNLGATIVITLLAVIGIGILVMAAIVERLRRWVRSVPLSTCGRLSLDTLPKTVKVTGKADAGPDGVLQAPLSKRPCVWYQVKVTRVIHTTRTAGTSQKPVDSEKVVYDDRSATPFHIDDGTGRTLLIPPEDEPPFYMSDQHKYLLGTVHRVQNRREMHLEPDLYGLGLDPAQFQTAHRLKYEEWIAPPGHDMTAVGEAARDAQHGLVMRKPEGKLLLAAPMNDVELDAAMKGNVRGVRIIAGVILAFAVILLIAMP